MRWLGARWAWCLVLLGGCGSCDEVSEELRVEGSHPYVHCAQAAAPEARKWKVGGSRLAVEGRTLELEPAGWPMRIVAFSGPGFSEMSPGPALEQAMMARPDLLVMLGGLGDTPATAERTIRLLARREVPTLALAGGRDAWDVWQEAFETLGEPERLRIIDATLLRRVLIRDNRLHIVAGAVAGRYARNADACGAPAEALAEREVESSDARRDWLIAWQAPGFAGAQGPATTSAGLGVAPSALTALASRLGEPGGLFASPHLQVMRPFGAHGSRLKPGESSSTLRLVVPRLAGPVMQRADGSRVAPGFALLELGDSGLKWLAGPSAE